VRNIKIQQELDLSAQLNELNIHNKHFGRYIKSPLNYIGGKYKILNQIINNFPDQYSSFVDLFAGGMNVSVNIDAKNIYVNDNLSYLVDMYKLFKSISLIEIIKHIEIQIKRFGLSKRNQTGYKNFRLHYNQNKNPLDLFVLIAFSFNHQIRFNNSHEYNNPFGRDRSSYNDKMKSNLIKFITKLQSSNYIFSSSSFENFNFTLLDKDSFIYCDPPYLITTGSYNDGKRGFKGWGSEQESQLLRKLDEINSLEIKFALSNVLSHKGKNNQILENWVNKKGYFIRHISSSYANSNYQSSKNQNKESNEVLITNYNPDKKKQFIYGVK
jgi:DNA adenine methylase